MLRTFLALPRSSHDPSRQVPHTISKHASGVSMAYIVGFRCAGCPFEMPMGASFAGALCTPILTRGGAQRMHSSAIKLFFPKASVSVESVVFPGVWKQTKSRGQKNSIAFLDLNG